MEIRSRPEVRALYEAPLADFIRARNELAKTWKATDKEAAAAVRGLAKPSVSAWAVNQLCARNLEEVEALLVSGDQMREALSLGDPAALQAAARARREALSAAEAKAAERLAEGGHGTSAAVLRRVRGTLEALATRGHAADGLVLGTFSEDLAPPGFEALAGLAGALPPAPAPRNEEHPKLEVVPSPEPDPEASKAEARANAIRARAALERAQRRLAAAELERDQSHERAEAAHRELEEAERRVVRARERAESTRILAAEAAEETTRLAAALKEAEAAAAKAERELTDTLS